MKSPQEYAKELLARKGGITEYHLTHLITRAMRDTRDACARLIEEEAEVTDKQRTPIYRAAASLLRTEFIIGGPVKFEVEQPVEN